MQVTYYDAQGNLNILDNQRCINMGRSLHPYAPICVANGQGIERIKGFYVNGILNSDAQASDVIPEIANLLIAGQPRADIDLEVHYNGTFDSFWKIVALPVVPSLKQQSGAELATKIRESLNSGFGRVILLAHSQGADIAKIAQSRLTSEEQRRVGFISLGGKSQIDGGVNLRHNSDLISKVAQFFSGGSASSGNIILEGDGRRCVTSFCHGTTDYLSHPTVQQAVNSAFAPSTDPSRRTWQRLSY